MMRHLKEAWNAIKYTLGNEHGWLGTALAIGSTLLGAAASKKKTKAQAQGAEENAKALLLSASRMEVNATAAEEAAEFRKKQFRIENARLRKAQIAGYGKAGVVLGEGTPLLVMEETAALARLDELAILYTGKVQATEYRNIAKEYRYQAEAVRKGGQAAKSAGKIELAQTLLSGASNIYSAWKAG